MDCASCATAIEGALRRLDGVGEIDVNVMGGRVRVAYDARRLDRADLARAIRGVGYIVHEEPTPARRSTAGRGDASRAPASFWARRGRTLMTAASGIALGMALVVAVMDVAPAGWPSGLTWVVRCLLSQTVSERDGRERGAPVPNGESRRLSPCRHP